MRNEKEPNYFYKSLSISSGNSTDRIADNSTRTAQPSLQLFPEGGSLVADLPCKIAFKALGPDGLGLNLTGVIIDNENKEVAKIISSHLGMGVFTFIPESGKTYKPRVTFANGVSLTQELPAIDLKGITLSVNTDDPEKIAIEIRANKAYYKENFNKGLDLVVYAAGAAHEYKPKLDNSVLGLDLPAQNFKTGIVRVSLFNASGEPLNERMVFVQNNDLLNFSIKSDKEVYAKRESVKLSLNVHAKDQNISSGSFAVSVIDESKILVDEDAGNSILSYFLLTSEVKGNVENPDYYFISPTKERKANLDALMLTQAYRRFVWKDMMNRIPDTSITYKPERSMNIAGRLMFKNGHPVADCKLNLIEPNTGSSFTASTNASGNFSFTNILFQSDTKFILKSQSGYAKNAILELDDAPNLQVNIQDNGNALKYNYNADILASLQYANRNGVLTAGNQVKEAIYSSGSSNSNSTGTSYRSSNLGGPGHADQVISGNQLKNSPTLSTGLTGLARGINFNAGIASLQTAQTLQNGQQANEPMLVVIDGAEIGRGANIDNINPGSVENVEILKGTNAAIYGVEGGQGVLVITTRQGSSSGEVETKQMSPGIYSIAPKGLYKAREFYLPAYNIKEQSSIPDQRTTIFWKPDVKTDANGNAAFNFFNADETGTYRVCIEGIDSNGNLGSQVFRYQVK